MVPRINPKRKRKGNCKVAKQWEIIAEAKKINMPMNSRDVILKHIDISNPKYPNTMFSSFFCGGGGSGMELMEQFSKSSKQVGTQFINYTV